MSNFNAQSRRALRPLVIILVALCSVALPIFCQTPDLKKLPLAFEKNQGQAAAGIDFVARGAGYRVALERGNARIYLHRDKDKTPVIVNLRVVGSRNPHAAAAQQLPGKVNYFLGRDASRWRTHIPTFKRIEYPAVYRGIDLAYYGNHGRLEYDFIVSPGADPAAIHLAADGANKIRVEENGSLLIETGSGDVRFARPVAYQEIAGARHPVESGYLLSTGNRVGFAIGSYNSHYPLLIDPSLVYSTYFGGSKDDYPYGIAIGPNGNAFVTGYTTDLDFPTVNPEQSFYVGASAIFVLKMSANGSSLDYATYLAGSSGQDNVHSIAVDNLGNAYVTGSTASSDFPVKKALYPTLNGPQDAFITKFNPSGDALVFSTYLGGSGYDYGYGVGVDSSHDVYVAGTTSSSDFPVTSGAYQTTYNSSCSFVTKINAADTALVWSTYFGENCAAEVQALALDSKGAAYLTGYTFGNLPVTAGAPQSVFGGGNDAFMAKLGPNGAALAYCTYLGGSQNDSGYGIVVDSSGSAYATGYTQSTDLPVTPSALQTSNGGGLDAFVARLNAAGTKWGYVTYLGGSRDEYGYAIAVDSAGDAFVGGSTISANFPHTAALQPTYTGPEHVLFRTNSEGSAWTPADAGFSEPSYYYGTLVIDPVTTSHLLAISGAGVLYQSTDNGGSWTPNSSMAGIFVDTLAFSPAGGTVYAGTFDSVYASTDSGNTWTFAGYVPFDPFCASLNLTVDPTTPTTVYAGGGAIYFYNANLSVSTDGGVNWTALNGFANAGVNGIAINPQLNTTLYAAATNGVYRSTNTGQSWTPLNLAGLQNPSVTSVAVDPTTPSTLYAAANGAVYKSPNSGKSWKLASTGLTGYVYTLALAPSQPTTLYAATASGVFVTTDSASSWSAAGLAGDTIYVLAVNPIQPSVAYAAVTPPSDSFVAKINPSGTALIYSTYLGGTNFDQVNALALDKSGDVFVTGVTESVDFPVTPGAFQGPVGTTRIAGFVSEISSSTPACTYSVEPASSFFYAPGGSAKLSVVSPTACAWSAMPSASWIKVASGKGPGVAPLAITVAKNTGNARTGSVAIGTATLAVIQQASGCTATLSTSSLNFPQAGGPQSIDVTAPAGCQWVATSASVFLTVTSGASGTGNGTLTVSAIANPFPGQRTGNLTVANLPVSATQSGTSAGTARTTAR